MTVIKYTDDPQRRYWLHHENYEGDLAFPLLSKGYLCYGWVYCALDQEFMNDVHNNSLSWSTMERKLVEIYQGPLAKNRYCLWRFIDSMKAGDWVAVPSSGEFSVYRIIDEKVYAINEIPDEIIDQLFLPVHRDENGFFIRNNNNEIVDLGLARKVELISPHVNKRLYVKGALASRMKYQMANIDLDIYRDQFLDAVNRAEENRPIHLRKELHKFIPDLLKAMKECLEPGKFECLVQWYFDKLGARTDIPAKNTSGKEGEEDIDVIANFDALKTTYYVQVKFHEGKTGSKALNQAVQAKETALYENNDEYTAVYWALTAADDFSDDTKQQAHELKERGISIRLINGLEFMEMLLDVGLVNIDDAFKK